MQKQKTQKLTVTAFFVAIMLLLGLTPLGFIPLPIKVSILVIPVAIGTIVLGLPTGLLLGGLFGATSAFSAFGLSPLVPPSPLVLALEAKSALSVLALCFAPRLIVPLVIHLVYSVAKRRKTRSVEATPLAAIAGSLTNTFLYLGMMLLLFLAFGIDPSQPVEGSSTALLAIIGGTGLIAGGGEALAAAIVVPAVTAAIWRFQHK